MTIRNIFIYRTVGIFVIGILAITGCKNLPEEAKAESDTISFQKVLSLQNISFAISTTGQGSMRQLFIQPGGLSIDNRKLTYELDGMVVDAEIEDLNSDGYPEIVIYTQSVGSGSYGTVLAYSVNNGKSLSSVYFPPVSDNPEAREGYMGHDEFTFIENSLVHRFPIYKEGDTNSKPTGGMRQIQYKLVDGEASRKYVINNITDFPAN